MRIAMSESEFDDKLNSAKFEAMKAFGDEVMLLEEFVAKPRCNFTLVCLHFLYVCLAHVGLVYGELFIVVILLVVVFLLVLLLINTRVLLLLN